jgi:hypothetical protein
MADQPETPAADPAAPATKTGYLRRHWLATTIVLVVIVPILVFTIWAGITLSYAYSDGTRTGFVQKLSRKGWVCKTWEGELTMTTMPGVAPQIFPFTVRSDSVAAVLTQLSGTLVSIHYREHRGVPTSCFGETIYFVDGVTRAGR